MTEIQNLISNIGFPIVACLFMFKQQQTLTSTIIDLKDTLQLIQKDIEKLKNDKCLGITDGKK